MAAKSLSYFRSPVTLSQLKAVAGVKADAKSGELVVEIRNRVIPNAWDDLPISRAKELYESQGRAWHCPEGFNFDSRQKINLLEQRRTARKQALERKTYQGYEDWNDCIEEAWWN